MKMVRNLSIVVLAVVAPVVVHAQILLDDFNALNGTLTGSWVGNASIVSSQYLQVGGNATNVNGYERLNVSIDASGMAFIEVIGRRDAGHDISTNVVFEFLDSELDAVSFLVPSSSFSDSAFSTVYIPVDFTLNPFFDPTNIESWSFGGGSTGGQNFRMSFDNAQFTAVPEPSTVFLLCLGVVGLAACRRNRLFV